MSWYISGWARISCLFLHAIEVKGPMQPCVSIGMVPCLWGVGATLGRLLTPHGHSTRGDGTAHQLPVASVGLGSCPFAHHVKIYSLLAVTTGRNPCWEKDTWSWVPLPAVAWRSIPCLHPSRVPAGHVDSAGNTLVMGMRPSSSFSISIFQAAKPLWPPKQALALLHEAFWGKPYHQHRCGKKQ